MRKSVNQISSNTCTWIRAVLFLGAVVLSHQSSSVSSGRYNLQGFNGGASATTTRRGRLAYHNANTNTNTNGSSLDDTNENESPRMPRRNTHVPRRTSNNDERMEEKSNNNSNDNMIGVPPVRIGGVIVSHEHDHNHNLYDGETEDASTTRTCSEMTHEHLINHKGATESIEEEESSLDSDLSLDHLQQQQQHQQQEHKIVEDARLLQIPCSLQLLLPNAAAATATPIVTYLDTGAQVTVMTYTAAKKAGLAHLIDKRYSGHASGVAGVSCRVLGRIPAHTVSFVLDVENQNGSPNDHDNNVMKIDRSPAITVLEDKIGDNGVELLLGLDVLEDWHAMICLRDHTLTIRKANRSSSSHSDGQNDENIVIPFLRKTPSSNYQHNIGKGHARPTPRNRQKGRSRTLSTFSPSSSKRMHSSTPPPSAGYGLDGIGPNNSNNNGATTTNTRPSTATTMPMRRTTKRVPWDSRSQTNHHHHHHNRHHQSDLQSDLDSLETNSKRIPTYMEQSTGGGVGGTTVDEGSATTTGNTLRSTTAFEDMEEEEEEEDEFFESDFSDYDGCNLSGI